MVEVHTTVQNVKNKYLKHEATLHVFKLTEIRGVGEGYTNSGGYVDFYYNNEIVGYLTSNTGNLILSAENGKTLNMYGKDVTLSAPNGSVNISENSTKNLLQFESIINTQTPKIWVRSSNSNGVFGTWFKATLTT